MYLDTTVIRHNCNWDTRSAIRICNSYGPMANRIAHHKLSCPHASRYPANRGVAGQVRAGMGWVYSHPVSFKSRLFCVLN